MALKICTHHRRSVTSDPYTLEDHAGAIYFCDSRCLCLRALGLATKPSLTEKQRSIPCRLSGPGRIAQEFIDITDVVFWATRHTLG